MICNIYINNDANRDDVVVVRTNRPASAVVRMASPLATSVFAELRRTAAAAALMSITDVVEPVMVRVGGGRRDARVAHALRVLRADN